MTGPTAQRGDALRQACLGRGISRVCHFTLARTVAHVWSDPLGVRCRADLDRNALDVLRPTDHLRLDGLREYINCSVEYPNTWMLRQKQAQEKIFEDWVVLLIVPRVLWRPGTLFTPRNAAAGGIQARAGVEGLDAMYAPRVPGAGGVIRSRPAAMLPACPTDGQAEVLLEGPVQASLVRSIAVPSPERAREERARLAILNLYPPIQWVIAPALFDDSWRPLVERGQRPPEMQYVEPAP